MNSLKFVIKSAVVGAIITLATGAVQNTPANLLGASWYGWPLVWVRKLVIAPQYNPWVISWYSLIGDFIFWSIIAGIIVYIFHAYIKPSAAKSMPTSSAKSKTSSKKN